LLLLLLLLLHICFHCLVHCSSASVADGLDSIAQRC
jgi:hypothetical protein